MVWPETLSRTPWLINKSAGGPPLELCQVKDELEKLREKSITLKDNVNKLATKLKPLEWKRKKLEPLKDELEKQRKKSYTLEDRVKKLEQLEDKVKKPDTDLKEGAVAWKGPFMQDLAAQILLFVRGDQPKTDVMEFHYFQNLLTEGHDSGVQYQTLRNIYDATDNYALGKELDGVVTKRNSKIHYKSVTDLEGDVQYAQRLLQEYPDVLAAYKHQCTTIKCYSTWKDTFRARFSTVDIGAISAKQNTCLY